MKKQVLLVLCAIPCLSCMTGMESAPQKTYVSIPVPSSIVENMEMTVTDDNGTTKSIPMETIQLEKTSTGTHLEPYDQYRLTVSASDTAEASGMEASVTATITYRTTGFQRQLLNFSVEYGYGPSVYLLSRSAEYGARGNPKSVSIDGNSYSENVDITARSVGCRASAMAHYGPSNSTVWMTVDVWI